MEQEFGHISEARSIDCGSAKAELADLWRRNNRVVAQKEKREGWREESRSWHIRLQLKMEDTG